MMRVLLAIVLGLIFFGPDEGAHATFGGAPGSTQLRAPAWIRPYEPAVLTTLPGNVVNVDWRDGPWFQITLTANVTFNPPINVGSNCVQIEIIQDATGSRTATWTNTTGGSGWKFSGGTAITLSTAAAAVDIATACPYKTGSGNSAGINIGLNYK